MSLPRPYRVPDTPPKPEGEPCPCVPPLRGDTVTVPDGAKIQSLKTAYRVPNQKPTITTMIYLGRLHRLTLDAALRIQATQADHIVFILVAITAA